MNPVSMPRQKYAARSRLAEKVPEKSASQAGTPTLARRLACETILWLEALNDEQRSRDDGECRRDVDERGNYSDQASAAKARHRTEVRHR
jgi:hypothetical protein